VTTPEPNLARPFAPHRLRIYLGATILLSVAMVVTTIGSATGALAANMTLDVMANIAMALPLVTVPFVVFWNAPGENRSRLETAAELTLVYLPFTAFSQLTYELAFLVGHVFGVWAPTDDPGWKWLWWQFGLADTRYAADNPFIFGVEFAAVLAGAIVFSGWIRLIRTDITDEVRTRSLWFGFVGCAMLFATTLAYFVSEARAGFADIGQGTYGLAFKFIGMNIASMIFPVLVLYAIRLQVDFLNRRMGARDAIAREVVG
jgi:hypothetical protein